MSGWEVLVLTRVLAFVLVVAVACTPATSIPNVPIDAGALAESGANVPDSPADAPPDLAFDIPQYDLPPAIDAVVFDHPNTFDVSNDAVVGPDVVPSDTPAPVDRVDANTCGPAEIRCQSACVNTDRDPANCGSCGRRCDALAGVDGARVRCEVGRCVLTGSCADDRADCDGDPTNGCETDLGTATNCGRCGTACSGATPTCSSIPADGGMTRVCTNGCTPQAPARCGMSCVNLEASPENCGACGTRCTLPNALAGCAAGACTIARCVGTFADCDGDPRNGCEVETTSTPAHCGACGRACPVPPNARAMCSSGICGFVCAPGFHDCGRGCVANTSVTSCGTSCTPCTAPPNATATCDGTFCGYTCNAGTHRCEFTCVPNTDPATCGTNCSPCPTPPNARATCDGSACGFTCLTGYHRCGSVCVSDASTNSCGSACTPCPVPANGTATCDGTRCGVSCASGFHLCGGICVPNADPATCGSSCTPCPVPVNGTATCNGTSCGFTCASGFVPSGSSCVPQPARLLAPLSAARVSSRRPTLRWTPIGAVTVQLCRDRAMSVGCIALPSTEGTVTPPTELAPGAWFWRVDRSVAGSVARSTVWQVFLPPRSAPRSNVTGFVTDFNGDGFADLTATSTHDGVTAIYHGSTRGVGPNATVTLSRTYVGPGVAAGDVNGDGYGDLLISDGPLDVYLGGASGLGARAQRLESEGSFWGGRLAFVGDVNGDGYGDALYARWYEVALYFGSATGLDLTAPVALTAPASIGGFTDRPFGYAGADVNGDGFSDLALIAGENALVYFGSTLGVGGVPARFRGTLNFGLNPLTVRAAGDVDGDGYADLVITEGFDQVMIFRGGPTFSTTPSQRIVAARGLAEGAGDMNGDGYDDIAVEDDVGRGWIFLGGASGVASTAAVEINGPVYFGRDLRGGGDLNGDGYSDLAVGGTEYVRVFLGGPSIIGTQLPDLRPILSGRGFGQYLASGNRTTRPVSIGWQSPVPASVRQLPRRSS